MIEEKVEPFALDAAPRIIGRPAMLIGAEEMIESDQWTLGRLGRDRPLFRVVFDDPEHTTVSRRVWITVPAFGAGGADRGGGRAGDERRT